MVKTRWITWNMFWVTLAVNDWVTLDQNSLDVFYVENAVSHTKKAIVRATRAHGIVDIALQSVCMTLCV